MKRTLMHVSVVAAGLGLMPAAALAHHGDAGRYIEEIAELTGVVVETQFVNPHAILVVDIADAGGRTVRWQAELGGALQLMRGGWKNDVKPGTRVTLTGRRLKSGAPYMNLTERARVIVTDTGKEVLRSANYSQPPPASVP